MNYVGVRTRLLSQWIGPRQSAGFPIRTIVGKVVAGGRRLSRRTRCVQLAQVRRAATAKRRNVLLCTSGAATARRGRTSAAQPRFPALRGE
jgi:hypothetical protein